MLDSGDIGARVDDGFRRFVLEEGVPGLSYGVVTRAGLVHAGALGKARLNPDAPARMDTVYRIASMTKSVTAACVLILRDRGLLSLDQPLGQLVPEAVHLVPPTADSGPVTIRQLLTMSAGLVEDDPWADRQLSMPPEDLAELLRSGVHFNRPPGMAFEYSNLGYALLGRAVAAVAGEELGDFAQRNLLRPLGMNDTYWAFGEVPLKRRAGGYRRVDGVLEEVAPLSDGAFGAMGGIWTTVPDFARYVAFQLDAWPPRNGGPVAPLSRASRREMQQPHRRIATPAEGVPPVGGITTGYGYGLFCAETPSQGEVVYHGGGLPGFGSHVRWLPGSGVAVVAFSNLTYARVSKAVITALEAVGKSEPSPGKALGPAPIESVGPRLLGLYDSWDDRTLLELAADNLLLDVDLAHRRTEVVGIRDRLGAPLRITEMRASGELRAKWLVECERGGLEIEAWMAPPRPLRLQVLRFREAARRWQG